MAKSEPISYDKKELRAILQAFKAMDDEAVKAAKEKSSALADFLRGKIVSAASSGIASRVAQGARVSKSSKVGELSFGFAAQRFSGGGTTQMLWGGSEFGSKKYRQFPNWNPQGWFIYPTLRANQNELVQKWEAGFAEIVKRYN